MLGRASVAADDEQLLAQLRSAMRDYDMPDTPAVPGQQVTAGLLAADRYRDDVDVAALITLLPGLLRSATTYAHTANSRGRGPYSRTCTARSTGLPRGTGGWTWPSLARP